MPRSFIITPLAPAQTDQALPVIQALHRDMTLAQWRGVVEPYQTLGDDGGVMACEMSDGHIRGLFCYRVRQDGAARVLTVPTFVAVGLFDAAATSGAQIEAIDRLAHNLGCGTVEVDLDGCVMAALAPKLDAAGLFGRLGYRVEGRTLVKDMEAEPVGAAFPVVGAA
ncbi:hypothetical protein [Azospirillum soli]|uniref:hypothetical protein n=1 Tax=Azospirillum soli TaxID=1304799 RepID=UPI001AE99ACD|nr:hypothetical protein [Azospirillum soli]MBP2314638.1 hypothetical protein [Azospirillum soli]